MAEGNKINKTFQLVALFLMLIALPAGSWYYLKTGMDYRIATMEELQELGQLTEFEIKTDSNTTLGYQDLIGNLVVAGFFSPEKSYLAAPYALNLQKLQDQFNDRERILFALHSLADGQGSLTDFAIQNNLAENPKVLLVDGAVNEITTLAENQYKLPLKGQGSLVDNPYLVLLDTTLTIRNYYDVRETDQMKKMVEHITLIMPPSPKKDIYLKRESEK